MLMNVKRSSQRLAPSPRFLCNSMIMKNLYISCLIKTVRYWHGLESFYIKHSIFVTQKPWVAYSLRTVIGVTTAKGTQRAAFFIHFSIIMLHSTAIVYYVFGSITTVTGSQNYYEMAQGVIQLCRKSRHYLQHMYTYKHLFLTVLAFMDTRTILLLP